DRKFINLKRLDLESCGIGDAEIIVLVDALINSRSMLDALLLGGNYIGDTGASHIAKYINHNNYLRVLVLRINSIGDEGLIYLSDAFTSHSRIEEINLSSNQFGDSSTMELCSKLQNNVHLLSLNLSGNGLCESLSQVSNLFEHRQRIRSLEISNNDFGFNLSVLLPGIRSLTSVLVRSIFQNTH
ncbi:NLRC3, partial [Acrasis kona]